jgi:two-component system chemotaxis sensor kinase CheA
VDDFERELKQDFLNEATDLLQKAEGVFLILEKNGSNAEILNEIFRLAHNLKGTSMAVGFAQLAGLTHKAEDLLLKLKQGVLNVTPEIITVLLEFNDQVNVMINGLKNNLDELFECQEVEQRLLDAVNGKLFSATTTSNNSSTVKSPTGETLTNDLISGVDESKLNQMLSEVTDSSSANAPLASKKAATAKVHSNITNNDEEIRVKLNKIEKLNNIVGELVILQTVLDQFRHQHEVGNTVSKSIRQLGKLSKEIQELSMSFRMIPIKTLFQKLARVVRDTSKTLGKEVDLKLIGEETEIDKTVLEKLADPLVHIVRNAMDHGLETKEDRVKAGKPEMGIITIHAYHEGSNLAIQIIDDGKGINPDIVYKKAIEKGVLKSDAKLTEEEKINLIFHAGFSTKDEVSEVSGRGVGMDVVKTNIEGLSGEVEVQSEVGSGSTFKILLPLTMAIIEGMVLKVNNDRFVVPLNQVHEFVRISNEQVSMTHEMGPCLNMRGEIIPLFSLEKLLLDKKTNADSFQEKISLIVKTEHGIFGLIVDDILNQQQVVVKNVGSEISDLKVFMGSTILGDGRPCFIIDVVEMLQNTVKKAVRLERAV